MGAHPGGGEGGSVACVVGRVRLTDVGADAEAKDEGAVVAGEVDIEPLLVVVLSTEGACGGRQGWPLWSQAARACEVLLAKRLLPLAPIEIALLRGQARHGGGQGGIGRG